MKWVLYIIILLMMFSCSWIGCNEQQLETKHLEENVDCEFIMHRIEVNLTDDYEIIRNEGDYDKRVTGTCHPTIDFEEYDLVIGRYLSPTIVDKIEYELSQTCPGEDLHLRVDILQTGLTMPDAVTFHALIPKMNGRTDIEVSVQLYL